MKPQFANSLFSFNATATSGAAGFPPSRVANYATHPLLRTWRSTVTTQTDIICDAGSAVAVRNIALLNVNFATVQIARSSDNVTYNDITMEMQPTLDVADGMYKCLNSMGSAPRRYFRIRIASQTPIDGAAYFSVGAVLLMDSLDTWPRDLIAPIRQGLVKATMQSGDESIDTGDQYLSLEFDGIFSNQETDLMYQLSRNGRSNPIFWKEGTISPEKIYLVRLANDISYDRHGFHVALSLNLKAWY